MTIVSNETLSDMEIQLYFLKFDLVIQLPTCFIMSLIICNAIQWLAGASDISKQSWILSNVSKKNLLSVVKT